MPFDEGDRGSRERKAAFPLKAISPDEDLFNNPLRVGINPSSRRMPEANGL